MCRYPILATSPHQWCMHGLPAPAGYLATLLQVPTNARAPPTPTTPSTRQQRHAASRTDDARGDLGKGDASVDDALHEAATPASATYVTVVNLHMNAEIDGPYVKASDMRTYQFGELSGFADHVKHAFSKGKGKGRAHTDHTVVIAGDFNEDLYGARLKASAYTGPQCDLICADGAGGDSDAADVPAVSNGHYLHSGAAVGTHTGHADRTGGGKGLPASSVVRKMEAVGVDIHATCTAGNVGTPTWNIATNDLTAAFAYGASLTTNEVIDYIFVHGSKGRSAAGNGNDRPSNQAAPLGPGPRGAVAAKMSVYAVEALKPWTGHFCTSLVLGSLYQMVEQQAYALSDHHAIMATVTLPAAAASTNRGGGDAASDADTARTTFLEAAASWHRPLDANDDVDASTSGAAACGQAQSPCSTDAECCQGARHAWSSITGKQVCYESACTETFAEHGSECETHSQCSNQGYCTMFGTCAALKESGAICHEDRACKSSACGWALVCA